MVTRREDRNEDRDINKRDRGIQQASGRNEDRNQKGDKIVGNVNRSEDARIMRTDPNPQRRSEAARELSNSRSEESKRDAGRKGGSHSHRGSEDRDR